MKGILLALLIGIALTTVAILGAGMAGGACHCETPTIVFFPFAMLGVYGLRWESISLPLVLLQYPVYSLFLAAVRKVSSNAFALVLLIMIVIHTVGSLLAMKLQHR